ncbi:MAG: HD-GYP domain-containing protein [Campylobacterales bacterium]|nr:HD-GYP domain-containing protein [Campylobacterales bacterium]
MKKVRIKNPIELHINETKFFEIEISSLIIDSVITFELFISQENGLKSILKPNTKITQQLLNKLHSLSIEKVLTEDIQRINYIKYLEDNIRLIIAQNYFDQKTKSKVIYDTASDITQNLFENPDAMKNIRRSSKAVVDILLNNILQSDNALLSMMSVSSYDYYTYTHCVDVSMYSLSLGKMLQFEQIDLVRLGTSALLHDIGKTKIENEIINKNGRLTDDEFLKIKKHPEFGYEIAKNLGQFDRDILSGIVSHHEKLDGTGYPSGLKNGQITNFAQIIAIADVFDALTTKRSYKPALGSFDALRLMRNEMSNHLNKSYLELFIKMLGKK